MTLTVGSLFSGIGGLDLGLERAGMNVIWQSEIDPYACRVLKKHWPEVPNHGDIKLIDWSRVERPAVICGGYPCQPFSTAGNRKGEEDPRHLWPWVRQAISELQPQYAILENVRGHLSLGGVSVIADLAAIGYDAEWRIVSAASVGAAHRRDRIIIVAYPNNERLSSRPCQKKSEPNRLGFDESRDWCSTSYDSGVEAATQDMAYPNGVRLEAQRSEQQTSGTMGSHKDPRELVANPTEQQRNGRRNGNVLGPGAAHWLQSQIGRESGYGGFPYWETEPDVGRVANGVPHRVDRLRGLGNAVVPQVAEVIGRLVVEHATHN